jgi:hypothetical protein
MEQRHVAATGAAGDQNDGGCRAPSADRGYVRALLRAAGVSLANHVEPGIDLSISSAARVAGHAEPGATSLSIHEKGLDQPRWVVMELASGSVAIVLRSRSFVDRARKPAIISEPCCGSRRRYSVAAGRAPSRCAIKRAPARGGRQDEGLRLSLATLTMNNAYDPIPACGNRESNSAGMLIGSRPS